MQPEFCLGAGTGRDGEGRTPKASAAIAADACLSSMPLSEWHAVATDRQTHLGSESRINLGSFYTPAKYVALVAQWLCKHGVDRTWTIADLSCGYGAFFELSRRPEFADCRFVGNDIDAEAVSRARKRFPGVEFTVSNALSDVAREKFAFETDERLVIVGNPPYNDVTSQINQKVKTGGRVEMDVDIRTRDLGMSSLLAYAKLKADCVAVLHPLSYIVKKSNYKAAAGFFKDYELLEHLVFNSQEFAGTSKNAGFPVVVALYMRSEGKGLSYGQICNMVFRTAEGEAFSLSGTDYVTDYIKKYPHGRHWKPEILFYTMRDINALMRSRTFIKERTPNAVDVDPAMLPYYCYVDCFKRYAAIPYWMGNFDVPFIKNEFCEVEDAVVSDAKYHHRDIFGCSPQPAASDVARIRTYIAKSLKPGR